MGTKLKVNIQENKRKKIDEIEWGVKTIINNFAIKILKQILDNIFQFKSIITLVAFSQH